ncbi:hypothetical protein E2C01_006491 [Portunus trituberculatus]|uniref:Uncharacterized protein n=1 Tax=Portunus trituberculatus TaxID=210409 RepID=A0A5B7CV79_PORTR|nr:hypothetical protein [Portunus trituberculatus]
MNRCRKGRASPADNNTWCLARLPLTTNTRTSAVNLGRGGCTRTHRHQGRESCLAASKRQTGVWMVQSRELLYPDVSLPGWVFHLK